MFLLRGIVFSHETVRDWEARLAPALADNLKVRGRWCYLYRAIDPNGHLVDTMLSEHWDTAAAQAFFRSCRQM
jgi:transposase-like protein